MNVESLEFSNGIPSPEASSQFSLLHHKKITDLKKKYT